LTEYPCRIEFEQDFVEVRQGGSLRGPASHEDVLPPNPVISAG